jgi:hypothetical protein
MDLPALLYIFLNQKEGQTEELHWRRYQNRLDCLYNDVKKNI